MDYLQAIAENSYWVDIAIGFFVLLYVSSGAVMGFASGVVRLFFLVVALGFVYLFADVVHSQIGRLPFVPENDTFKVIAALMLFASLVATKLVSRVVEIFAVLTTVGKSLFSPIGGASLAIVRSTIVLVVVTLVMAIGVLPQSLSPHWEKSFLLPYIGHAAESLVEALPRGKRDSLAGELKEIVFQFETKQPLVPFHLARLGREHIEEAPKQPRRPVRIRQVEIDSESEVVGEVVEDRFKGKLAELLEEYATKDTVGETLYEANEEDLEEEKEPPRSLIRDVLANRKNQ